MNNVRLGLGFGFVFELLKGLGNCRKLLGEDGLNGEGDILVFLLGPIGASKFYVVDPGAKCAAHVHPTRGVHRQDFAGALFGHTDLEHVVVEFLGIGEKRSGSLSEGLNQLRVKIGHRVLAVFGVLAAKFWEL